MDTYALYHTSHMSAPENFDDFDPSNYYPNNTRISINMDPVQSYIVKRLKESYPEFNDSFNNNYIEFFRHNNDTTGWENLIFGHLLPAFAMLKKFIASSGNTHKNRMNSYMNTLVHIIEQLFEVKVNMRYIGSTIENETYVDFVSNITTKNKLPVTAKNSVKGNR